MAKTKKYFVSDLLMRHVRTVCPDTGVEGTVNLPEGCAGILFVFRTKKALKGWLGKSGNVMVECEPTHLESQS